MKTHTARLVALVLLAGASAAQGTPDELLRSLASWRSPDLDLIGPPTEEELAWRPPFWIVAHEEELAASLAIRPAPIAREALEGGSERFLRERGLPGGIVLGARAHVPAELDGARIARDERGAPGVQLAAERGGGFLRAPPIEPGTLRAYTDFLQEDGDALIDLVGEPDLAPRVTQAFAGGELEALLVRMDGVPHRCVPETRAWKTLIVDREVRVELRAGELAFAADLEVRGYDDGGGTGWARRVLMLDARGADFVGPRTAQDLGAELAPLAEIAGWLGFLRWAARTDPPGFAALCAEQAR